MKLLQTINRIARVCSMALAGIIVLNCPVEAEQRSASDTGAYYPGTNESATRVIANPFYPDSSTGLVGFVSKEGARMANILLLLDIYDKEKHKQWMAHVLTDSAGEFFVPLPPGNYRVVAITHTVIPGYMGVQRGEYDDLRYRVEPSKIAGPIEVTYTRPVHVEGLQAEESLTAERTISWGCDYANAEYQVRILRMMSESRGCVQFVEPTVVSDMWKTDTSLTLPVTRFTPGHYSIAITARDAATKENVSWTNGQITFWVGAITRVQSNEEETSRRVSNAAINGVPEKIILVRHGQQLVAIKFHYPSYPTLMNHDECMPDGTRYLVSDTISYETWYQGDGSFDFSKGNVIAGSGELIQRLRLIPGRKNQYETDSTNQTTITAGPLAITWSPAFVVYARRPANFYENYNLCQTEWDRVSEIDSASPGLQWVGDIDNIPGRRMEQAIPWD